MSRYSSLMHTRRLRIWPALGSTRRLSVVAALASPMSWRRLSLLMVTCCGIWITTGTFVYNFNSTSDPCWPWVFHQVTTSSEAATDSDATTSSSTDAASGYDGQHTSEHALSSGQQHPPPQSQTCNDTKDEDRSWESFLRSLKQMQWTSIPDKLTSLVVPDWIRVLPAFMTKFQRELSMASGSLAAEIWREANDPECNPEIIWDALVRVSNELCHEEQQFLALRKHHTARALARYLDLAEEDVNPDDVPTIAMCGSGGGLRALVAGAGSYIAAREAGLFDCITYTAGVSGSCWLQALYYSSIGRQSHTNIVNHLKNRLSLHLAYPPAAFNLISSAPTNKFLLTPLVEKLKGIPEADFGLVDVYGLLLAARLLIPKAELAVSFDDLKLSNQQRYLVHGQEPLPIYSAVRHDIPIERNKYASVIPNQDQPTRPPDSRQACFQWFEFTPYEFFCEEAGAGIPVWSLGRQFQAGKTKWRSNHLSVPELRISLLMGIWGSAFCATLSHYYKEVRPILSSLTGFGGLDQLIAERDQDLVKVHPIDPATIPNFTYGMNHMLPQSCPQSLIDKTHLQLMDAGMSNNLPIYPLLRPGRKVDVIIAFDASADVKTDNWLKVVDGYARQRSIKGWPVGAGWPPAGDSSIKVACDLDNALARSQKSASERMPVAQAAQQPNDSGQSSSDLGYCNVWIGSMEERTTSQELPFSKLVSEDWELQRADAGIAVVYFPLLANPSVPHVDPKDSDYLSTWNFVYTPPQVEKVVELAGANFSEGCDQTRRTIRAIYERKRRLRVERANRMTDIDSVLGP